MFTSKRTLKKLIDELKIRMKKCGNIAQIEATEIIIKSIIWWIDRNVKTFCWLEKPR